MTKTRLPTIALLGTGGTIASSAAGPTALADYRVTDSVATLTAAVPGIERLATIQSRQMFNVESHAITNAMLLKIAARLNRLLRDPAIDGAVVTHGTDTLEESAYFLNLTVKSPKPVVMVGAMRPATALSADGPLNLYNAVLLATSPRAHGQGVLIAMNDRIFAARFAAKAGTSAPDAFQSHEQGCLGQVYDNRVEFFQASTRIHTAQTEFSTSGLKALPRVDIIYDHQDAGLHLYQASVAAGAKGIVIAGCGNGSLSPSARKGARLAVRNRIACVRASRTGSGVVSPRAGDGLKGLIAANSLNPQKARILLMLALSAGAADIQACFDKY